MSGLGSTTWRKDAEMTSRSRFPGVLVLVLCAAVLALLLLPASALALTSTGDGGWQWLDPQPQGNNLEAVVAVDAQRVVAGGDNGTLLTTADGGATWSFHVPGIVGAHVASLSNAGSGGLWAVVWAQSENPRALAHSTDGGATWAIKTLGEPVSAVDFADAKHGWALVYANAVWSTSNGGLTWKRHAIPRNWWFSSIDFIDATHGWAAGSTSILDDPNAGSSAAIFVTSDGGVTWHKQPFAADSDQMNSVSFANGQDGWACGDGSDMGGAGTLVATTDGGAHWSAQSAGTDWDLSGITFIDATHGWLPEGGSIYATTDGGTTWTAADSGLPSVTAVSFANDLDGYAVGPEGGLATTIDAGVTWQVRSATTPAGGFPLLGGIVFPDASHGWTFGGDQLLSTSDGGATWSSQTVSAGLDTLSFPDATEGWATGETPYPSEQQVILHTSDGGQTWQTQYSTDALDFTGLDFLNDQFGWAAGTTMVGRSSRPIVGATTDGGTSWQFVTLGHALSGSTSVHFAGTRYGWIACTPARWRKPVSTIYRTTNGGNSWKLADTTRRGITLHSITFVGDMHGWAVGQNSGSTGGACVVLATRNGGRTWSMQKLRAPYYYAGQQVDFTDGSHGWIACGPVVYATTDGGRHWRAQRPGSIVNALAFTDAEHGWAAAQTGDWMISGGGILTTTTGGFQPGGLR
jgi:photosystem II stability/assembly factor-like uncharacterized protein